MRTVKVLTDPANYMLSSHGTVFGPIWIEIGNKSFPENRWSDMVVAILRGWLEEYDNFIRKDTDQMKLFFMDGPFAIQVLKEDSNIWMLHTMDNGKIEDSVKVKPSDLLKTILDASFLAIKGCRQKTIVSTDLPYLEQCVEKLK